MLGQFLRERYDPVAHRWVVDDANPIEQNIPGDLNSSRLPWYSRADVSASRSGHLFGTSTSAYVSIMNVFNAHNPAAYLDTFTGRPTRATFPNLPFAPTFGLSIAF